MLKLDDEIDELDEYADPDGVAAELEEAVEALDLLKERKRDLLRFAAACEKAARALAEVAKQAPAAYEVRNALVIGPDLDLESRITSDAEWGGLSLTQSEGETELLADIVAALEENATAPMKVLVKALEKLLEDVIERNEEWLGDEDEDDDPSDEEE